MAVEMPLKYKYRCVKISKRNPSRSNNSGTNKHRGEQDKNRLTLAQSRTRENQRVMIITPTGKRKFIRADT